MAMQACNLYVAYPNRVQPIIPQAPLMTVILPNDRDMIEVQVSTVRRRTRRIRTFTNSAQDPIELQPRETLSRAFPL